MRAVQRIRSEDPGEVDEGMDRAHDAGERGPAGRGRLQGGYRRAHPLGGRQFARARELAAIVAETQSIRNTEAVGTGGAVVRFTSAVSSSGAAAQAERKPRSTCSASSAG